MVALSDLKKGGFSMNNLKEKIRFIVKQEKTAGNSYKWVYSANSKTINELYDYWTQEL